MWRFFKVTLREASFKVGFTKNIRVFRPAGAAHANRQSCRFVGPTAEVLLPRSRAPHSNELKAGVGCGEFTNRTDRERCASLCSAHPTALIPSGESIIVQVDCGGTLLAEITPGACRDMGLQEGDFVYCLIKTHAIIYLSDLDNLPYQRVVSHGDQYYYLDAGVAALEV